MKVFKFYSGNEYYAYSGHDENEAKQALLEETHIEEIDRVEEIPESEWDEKKIKCWEDNDIEKEPYLLSIRDNLMGKTPCQIFTNVFDF